MQTTNHKFFTIPALALACCLGLSAPVAAQAASVDVAAAASGTTASEVSADVDPTAVETGEAVIPAATGSVAHDHQVARIFRATLGRNPDASGLVYWSEQLQSGVSASVIVQGFLDSDEHARRSSGDAVVDAYRWALLREPDAEGLAFWSARPVTEAVLAIADSGEHQATTGTMAPPAPVRPDVPSANEVAPDPVGDSSEITTEPTIVNETGEAVIPAATGSVAHDHQVARIFRATLGRNPDASGLVYWSEQLQSGVSASVIVQGFLDSDEHARRSSGDAVVDAYRWALLREPDAEGLAFWSARPVTEAVLAIADSGEHQATTGTMAPPAPVRPDVPASWVDAGHGVWVPPILLEIRWCESNHDYTAANSRSSARGAYQFLTGSWAAYGHAERYGVPYAHLATPAQQDEAALITWQVSGTRPWNASRHCWG